MAQCHGTTTKGLRCKITTSGLRFCHYHDKTSPARQKPRVDTGSIYIYTLAKFFDKRQKDWFKVRNLPGASKNKHDWSLFELKKSPFIFLKIGMTSQNVKVRIRQWEDKCKHDIVLVNPENDGVITKRSLSHLFKGLSLTKRTKYQSLTEEGGFHCGKQLSRAESEIHQVLRQKYGKGIIFCKGCSEDPNKVTEFMNGYNIHIEWFLIPKKDLSAIYSVIDSICIKYT